MKPSPKFKDRANPAGDLNLSAARGQCPGEDLQQSALAGPISTHQTEYLATAKLERDVSQRPEFLWSDPTREQTSKYILRLVIDREHLRNTAYSRHDRVDCVSPHRTPPKLGRRIRNRRKPRDKNARLSIAKTSQTNGCEMR